MPILAWTPITAHWGIADPAAAEGADADKRRAFRTAFDLLEARVKAFVELPLESLDRVALQQRLKAIGAG